MDAKKIIKRTLSGLVQRLVFLTAVAVLVASSACALATPALAPASSPSPSPAPASAPTPAPTPTPSPTQPAAPKPTLTFLKPFAGYDESIGLIHVALEVTNFNLVDKVGQMNMPGEGHIIYYFNVKPPTTPGQPAFTSKGTYAVSASVIYNWRDVGLGRYVLYAQLVNNDNTPLDPPVVAEREVKVTPCGCT